MVSPIATPASACYPVVHDVTRLRLSEITPEVLLRAYACGHFPDG